MHIMHIAFLRKNFSSMFRQPTEEDINKIDLFNEYCQKYKFQDEAYFLPWNIINPKFQWNPAQVIEDFRIYMWGKPKKKKASTKK